MLRGGGGVDTMHSMFYNGQFSIRRVLLEHKLFKSHKIQSKNFQSRSKDLLENLFKIAVRSHFFVVARPLRRSAAAGELF